jgi:hypothetical protein
MQTITTIGLDIAKSVFQVYGIDAVGNVLIRRQLDVHSKRISYGNCGRTIKSNGRVGSAFGAPKRDEQKQ